jgi:hypothetical protein
MVAEVTEAAVTADRPGGLAMRIGLIGLVSALLACSSSTSTVPPQQNNTEPLTVVVDTGKIMSPPSSQGFGGQGIGVFVQYTAGGHWHVFWACDTTLSSAPCNFDLVMSVTDSSIQSAQSNQFSGNDTMTSSPSQIVASTYTTTQVDAVDFDTTPGAKMMVDASIAGLPRDGSIFFFVEDNQVRGSYPGPLTDPLVFEPSTP